VRPSFTNRFRYQFIPTLHSFADSALTAGSAKFALKTESSTFSG